MKKTIPLFCAALFACSSAVAATTSYECKFSEYASPDGLKKGDAPLELRFVLDTKTKKAYLLGNNGSSEVMVIPNTGGISFLEVTDSGNVMVTAVTTSGKAVHSRNGIMTNEIIPSQYYGMCVRK